MSDDKITITLEDRKVLGKGLAKIREEGSVPAVVHNHGKESIHVKADYKLLSKAFDEASYHHPVQLKLGDKQRLAMIKDVDFEPTKRSIRHVVFQAIRQNEKVQAEIPILFEGEDDIPAERAGLMVLRQLDTVQVEALPGNLPNELKVDATKLVEEGDRLTVADIEVPKDVVLMVEPEHPIAVVEMPRDQVAEADAAAEALAEDAAGSVEDQVEVEGQEESTEEESSEGEEKPAEADKKEEK